ncbi:LamB/YcsF family protein [Amylibacter sp. SFDW26]|uniref:LamB/YcsF family protein n=1 Tax=Amylibacter sp. SFDW26 TaxID=2652722 RepID=UPI001261F12E|nr:5-oxoprolinase subunit PxpA [Amylibacter sp. SFDW26]KAB7616136.1 LamB/YcsF family protein [Amylibacter sp. SFDW26]
MTHQIDLNSDLGESFGPWHMGDDATMLSLVNSANIACGGHASDPETMYQTLSIAAEKGVIVGAHPGYNDREGFGRRVIPMEPDEVGRMVAAQIGALMGVAALVPVKVQYVKAHGALANLAARDRKVADAYVSAALKVNPDLAILAISGTQLEEAGRAAGAKVYSEIFADRGYLSNGQLVPRGQDGAMIHDADEAADRLVAFLETGLMPVIDGDPIPLAAHSICVHGDSDGAVTMTRRIQDRLTAAGVTLTSFIAPEEA